VEHHAIGNAPIIEMTTIENPVLDSLGAIDAHWMTLEIARLHRLDALDVDVAAIDPALGAAHAKRMATLPLNLDGAPAVATATVSGSERLALTARCDKAATTLSRTHLVAATAALDISLETASAAVLDAERVSASAGLIVAATANLNVSAASVRD
jgi:hypothetical protein